MKNEVRPIDAIELQQKMCALCNQDCSDEPCEPSDCVFIRAINEMPTLTPPNEPLTLDSRLTSKMVTCPKGWQGVRDTRFYCPGCKKVVKKGEAYCHKCGQALIFPVQRYDKENNRIWLDFSDRRPPEGEEENACRM